MLIDCINIIMFSKTAICCKSFWSTSLGYYCKIFVLLLTYIFALCITSYYFRFATSINDHVFSSDSAKWILSTTISFIINTIIFTLMIIVFMGCKENIENGSCSIIITDIKDFIYNIPSDIKDILLDSYTTVVDDINSQLAQPQSKIDEYFSEKVLLNSS